MPLCLSEFGEKVCDTYFEHGTPPENKETGPGGLKARESLSKFSRIVLLLFILLSDIKILLNFARGQQALLPAWAVAETLEYFYILTQSLL